MLKNKGFTLIELLGVLALVGVMLLITIPSIIKLMENNEKNKNNRFLKDLYNATEVYVENNRDLFPTLNIEGGRAVVSALTLIDSDYIKASLIDPITEKRIANDDVIVVDVNVNKTFKYTFFRVGEENYTGPRIIASSDDIKIMVGTKYDLLNGVIALDRSNGEVPVDVDIKDTSLLTIGEHDIIYTATDAEGNSSALKKSITVKNEFIFDYTGNSQTFNTPTSGKYKIEVWGAQGGDSNTTYLGGKGGYSSADMTLQSNQTLYIYIGGKGNGSETVGEEIVGGYNGGGIGFGTGASGGGATHVATENGLLSTLSSKTQSILLIAGGGGGSVYYNDGIINASGSGGAGGGIVAVAGNQAGSWANRTGQGGNQTAGGLYGMRWDAQCGETGTFGQGGDGIKEVTHSQCPKTYVAGGGSGYFGGGSGRHVGGGGGSGYAKTDATNIVLKRGNESFPSHITGVVTGNSGNGYAKITYLGK